MEIWGIVWAVLALAAGGVLKGAIGAGAPLLAVPLLALLYNVPLAVAVFTIPSLLSNIWQGWAYRKSLVSARMGWTLALTGAAGALVGSVLLAVLSGETLMAVLAGLVFLYIGLRMARPEWVLSRDLGHRLAAPAGFIGGVMQGAGGISAPVSITFLNAMRLERDEFIATIAVFFGSMSLVQIPALMGLGILTPGLTLWSFAAAVPLFGAMPFGAWLGKRFDKAIFDRIILWLLAAIAVKLLYTAFV